MRNGTRDESPEMMPRIRRILVIDDNDSIHLDFRKILGAQPASPDLASDEEALFGTTAPAAPQIGFQIESALQGQEGCAMVRKALAAGAPYHVAFVDMRMPPGWDGVETIEKLWEVDPDLQVVICTAFSDYSWDQIVNRLGPSDRLLILKKPFDELEVCQLASALTEKWSLAAEARIKRSELEQLVQERTAELKQAALLDRLTGLPNRALLNDRLIQLIRQSERDPAHKFALLFLDFDRFKVVNDSLGHQFGDLLLKSIADRLRKATRCSDTITPATPGSDSSIEQSDVTAARLGGDEFIVVLDGLAEHHDSARVAERLLAVLSTPYELKGHIVHSTASIGITTSAGKYAQPEEMIRDADTAMYHAKVAGKARFVVFDHKMHEEAVARLAMETDLRQAVEGAQLILHYQPIVSMTNGQTVAFEALVRWMHPTRGMIPPIEFIPLAEEIGIITPLGYWVLEEACRQLADWRREHSSARRFSMSVNLSRKQLAAPDLTQRVASVLAANGLDPTDLTLEITENAIMEDAEGGVRCLQDLRKIGVQLHMDDFGSGYSSLAWLHRFPTSGIKIDRSFISSINKHRDYAAVVHAIISLTHSLGIGLIAEGVETAEQATMLQAMGCDRVQGYYFSRPLDASAAEAFALAPPVALKIAG